MKPYPEKIFQNMISGKGWLPIDTDHPALKGAAREDQLFAKPDGYMLWYKPEIGWICIMNVVDLPKGCYLTSVAYQGKCKTAEFFIQLHENLDIP